jgi:hypothetical protein
MSRRNLLHFRVPELILPNHHVNDGKEFPHTGDDGNFLKFVSSHESLVEGFDNWIAANSSQRGHVKLGA